MLAKKQVPRYRAINTKLNLPILSSVGLVEILSLVTTVNGMAGKMFTALCKKFVMYNK